MPKYISKMFIYGLMIWLIPFLTSFAFYNIKTQQLILNELFFKSLMLLIISFTAQIFIILFFKNLKKFYLLNGLLTGLVWIFIAWTFDLLLTWRGLFQLSYLEYFQQIGIRYLIILFNTLTVGYLLQIKSKNQTKDLQTKKQQSTADKQTTKTYADQSKKTI